MTIFKQIEKYHRFKHLKKLLRRSMRDSYNYINGIKTELYKLSKTSAALDVKSQNLAEQVNSNCDIVLRRLIQLEEALNEQDLKRIEVLSDILITLKQQLYNSVLEYTQYLTVLVNKL